MGKLSTHFTEEEWRCHNSDSPAEPCPDCGGQCIIREALVDMAEAFRLYLCEEFKMDVPLNVIDHCVNRCERKNERLVAAGTGAVPDSPHIGGYAVDCHAMGISIKELHREAQKCHTRGGILRGGLGFYPWGIHFDIKGFRTWGMPLS